MDNKIVEELKKAIETGIGEGWGWNSDDEEEERYDTFDSELCLPYVLKVIEKYFKLKENV